MHPPCQSGADRDAPEGDIDVAPDLERLPFRSALPVYLAIASPRPLPMRLMRYLKHRRPFAGRTNTAIVVWNGAVVR